MGGTLTFTGGAWGINDPTARTLTIQGNGNTAILGNITAAGANHVLTKGGTGLLSIAGTASTFLGNTNITGGAIQITDFRSINNNTAAISLGNATTTGGNLIIGGTGVAATAAGLTTSKTITLNTTSASNSIYANQSGTNPVILNGAITKIGAATTGNLILGGSNTTDNIVNVVVPVESTPSTGGLVKLGAGTWVLNAANTYAGSTQIQAGTLKLRATGGSSDVIKEAASNTIVFTNDSVTQTAGGTMEFRGFLNTATTETLGALTPTAGAAKIVAAANGTGSTTLTFSSLGTRGAGAVVDYQPGASSTIAFTTLPTVTNGILGAASTSAFQTFKGVDWATLSGSNVVAFSGYTALPTSFSGTGGAAVNYSMSANASSTGTASINTVKLVGAGANPTLTLGGILTLTGRAILFDNTNGVATITGSQLGAVATEVHVITNGSVPGNALTINSLIGGTTGSFTKSGTGSVIVGGNNTFTGNVIINEGTVQLSGGTATLGVNSTAANVTTLRQDGTLDINAAGVSQTIGIGALQGAGVITNSGGGTNTAGTISLGRSTSTGTTVFSGVLQDGGGVLNVTVDGTTARTQALIGQSTYTGVTTIATGAQLTVDVLANGGASSGIGASSNAASNLVFNGTAPTLIYRGNLRTGSLNLGSASATTDRLFTISGSGAVLSSTVTNNNAIVWSNTGAIVHGTNADRTLTLTGTSAGDNTFNPQLTNSTGFVTSLTKSNTGQWNLGNSNNTYTGATTVSNGILGLNNNGALPSGSPLVLGSTTTSGILQMSGTLNRNLTATPTAGAGTITWGGTTGGGGFAAHATTLTVTLDGGAGVTWGSGGFVGTGGVQSLIFGSGGSLADVVFTNAINLGTATRTVTVNDNGNTGADFATLSGVLSGGTGGGLIKNGSGILRLTGANTYTGTTEIQGGTLVVSSLGSSGSSGATSVGDQQNANTAASAVILGNATTTGGILQYVGTGETSDRYIRLNGTTASNQIHADGSGPLILTNVANDFTTPTGAKTLFLRGSSSAGNMITSQLTNDGGGGTLGVTIDGAATWILTNGANSYTGTTTVSSGALGIGHDTAIGGPLGGAITVSNGNVFAYGGDRTIANAITLNNNANWGFVGDYSLTFTNAILGTSANSNILGNSIVAGKALTFQGLVANGLNANRSWTLDGPGETVVNGVFSTSTAFGLSIVKTGNGTLTLGTNGATSNWNQASAGIDLDRGTLKFTASNAINSSASTFGGLTISPEVATTDTATVDLNGTTQTINALTATTDGTTVIDNTSASAAAFRFGANNSAVTFGSGTGTYTIQNTGAGALDIIKLGNTTATFISGITLAHKGVTASEEGGVLSIASPVTATSGLRAVGVSTLALTGGITNPNLITSIEVGGGSSLTLLDGTGSQINQLTSLALGNTGTGTATLNLNVGDITTAGDGLGTDTLRLLTGGTLSLGNTITFNLTDAGLNPGQTYTLLNLVDGGITAFGTGNIIQGAMPGGFTAMTWNVTDSLVQVTTGALITDKLYWTAGGTLDNWSDVTNWAKTNKDGLTPAVSIPGQGNDVYFIADSLTGGAAVSTTLEQNFKINSINFEASTTPANTPSSVTVAPGALSTARLEIAPQAPADGIAITAGGSPAVTISTALKIGAAQTWNVADAATVLTISGGLQGEADVTKNGSGKVILSAAADPTFNGGQTTDFTINGGNLEFSNSGALGTTANSNLVNVIVNGGGFYYNNATGATLPHAITLAGGALSGGGGNHTYSGPVNVSAASAINLADSNGPNTATARNITLSGVVSGSGNLTLDGNNTASSGNQISGTLTLNNAGTNWTGDLLINRGTVTLASAVSPSFTSNDVTFNAFGRVILQGVNAQTLTRTGLLTYGAGSVGEFQVDNTSASATTDFLVDQSGLMTLGSGGTGASVRLFLADAASKLNITGGVILGGNSSISVGGDAAGIVIIPSVISDGGSGYSLAVNDDAGGWGTTNRTLRLTGLNTFTGNVTLAEGVLEFNTVTNISGGASALGNGTAIATSAAGTLKFIGTAPQATNRPITTTGGALTLSANGATAADTITYNGLITVGPTGDGSQIVLSGATGRTGIITGGILQTLDTADATVNGGTWTHQTSTSRIGDDVTVTGSGTILNLDSGLFQVRDDFTVTTDAVLNLNGTGVLSFSTATLSADASLRAAAGGIINLGANNAVLATDFDGIRIGTDAAGIGTLNTGTFSLSVSDFILGNRNVDRSGVVTGTGVVTATNNIDLYGGSVAAGLAAAGAITLDKLSLNTVTLSGNNSGLTGTGANVISEGSLILDYTTSTASKLVTLGALDMRGGSLTLNGNASSPVSQTVASFTIGSGGNNVISLNAAGGQGLVLNLNALTRAINAQDGTLRIVLPSGTQSATNGVTTDTLNTLGTGANAILGGWLTVDDGTGVFFARNLTNAADGNIVAASTTSKDAVGTWLAGENISDSTGFTGTLNTGAVNSLRFNAAAGSDLILGSTGVLGVTSGGVLVTSGTGGNPSLVNGTIFSGASASNVPELLLIQDSAQTFEVSADIRVNHAVTKSGTGTLRLTGNNVYTGTTEIQNGTLQLSGGNAIGDTSLVNLSGTRATTLQLLSNETIGRLAGGSRQTDQDLGTVAVGTNILTMNQSANTTFAGFFTGTGGLVMNAGSTGNLNMTNSSTGFTGIVTVSGGLFQLSGIGRNDASSFTINNTGGLLMDKNGATTSGTQILDTASITLNSAIGNQTVAGGLWIRRDQGSAQSETVGVVTAGSGTSYVRAETTAASAASYITADSVVRQNRATLVVLGNGMALTSGRRSNLRVATANEAALISSMTGGAGAAATATVSILPWIVSGDKVAGGAITAADMGNSLTTYAVGSGFRPLDFTTEYATYATAGAANNTRESLAAILSGLAGRTVNSLVIDNNNTATVGLTGSGAGQTLTNTSGAFLFTISNGVASTAYSTTLGGFDSGIAVGGTEYVFHVVNPSYAATTSTLTTTVASPLTSSADITKSGRGTLILNQVNTAGGGARQTTINEGVLQIADLDNIGGTSGNLVFAGGTLRLDTGFADDISTRGISFLTGGGTLDTNGIDLTLAGSLGSGVGGFTKTGAGNLTLNGSATFTGATTISGGTVTIGANNALGSGGNLTLAGGTTLAFSGSNTLTQGLVTTSGASPAITGTGTISASSGFFFNHTGDTAISAVLAGAGGVLKAQANIITLSGLNTYTGTTEVQAGTLSFDSIANVGGGASALGAPTTAEAGIIRMGLTTTATTLQYTGSGHTSDRLVGMQGTTGGVTIDADGTGALGLGGARFENAGNKTLTLRGSSLAGVNNSIGAITELAGVLTLNKTDGNTWVVNGASSYTGVTQVDNGTLKIGVNDALPVATTTRLGTGATAGTLDLNGFNQTIASLLVQTNSATVTNNLVVTSGKTLTVNGAVTIGANAAASTTLFATSGGGAFVNNNDGGTFGVGAATGTTNVNAATADFSGLASFTANLGAAGTFRVGDANTNSSGAPVANSTVILASTTNTITAGTVSLGQGTGQGSSVQTLSLGAGTNAINATTINIGGNTTRSGGAINFAGSGGSVVMRGVDGTSAVTAINMVNGNISTGFNQTSDLLLAGHNADILVTTLTMASRSASTGAVTSALTFDQGTLDVTTMTMASRTTASSTGDASATVSIGGGITAIDSLTMAVNTSAGGAVTANFNVTGGSVTLGTGTGTAVNMANAASGRTVTSSMVITGGTVAVTGNIVRTGGAGTENASVTLNGGTLDLNGNSIGSGSVIIPLNAQSGTLRNLGELNGGGTLTKSTAGVLVLEGPNTYTGRTVIDAGKLSISDETNLGANPSSLAADQLTLNGGTLLTTANLTIDDANRGITVSAASSIETAVGTTATISSTILGGAALSKEGTGTLIFTAVQTGHTGVVTVNAGTLAGLGGTGGDLTVSTGTLSPGITGTPGAFTVSGSLTVSTGGTLATQIGGATTNAAAAVLAEMNTNGNLIGFIGSVPSAWENYLNGTTAHSHTLVSGTASAPAITGTVALLGGYSPVYGDVFDILDWGFSGAMTSTPSAFDFGGITLGSGLAFNTDLFASNGIIVVVPEPSRVLFLMLGLLGLMLRRRRK